MENLWYISLAECKDNLMKADNYGWGLDQRKAERNLRHNSELVEKHKESYHFWLDLYCYKLMRDEGRHPPLWVIEPRWEQEISYDFWNVYFSYSWQGAKQT